MSDSPNLGLPFIEAAQAQKHVTHNEALALIDAVVQIAVSDMGANAPPASPASGARVVVGAAPTGLFAGRTGRIASYDEAGWRFAAPKGGWIVWSSADRIFFVYSGSAWIKLTDALGAIQNLAMLGLGATADATNPLSVRAPNALFTARYAADGGDGSLRFKLNKETAAATVSQLYQTNWSGRAETGLIGDDLWAVRRSVNGVTWTTPFVVDAAQARVLDGAPATPGLAFMGSPTTGFSRGADGAVSASAAGVEVWRGATTGVLTIPWSAVIGDNSGTRGKLTIGAGLPQGLYFSVRGSIGAFLDGVFTLRDNAGASFGRLQFGGTTNAYPALKRSGAILQARLADDTAFATLEAETLQVSGAQSRVLLNRRDTGAPAGFVYSAAGALQFFNTGFNADALTLGANGLAAFAGPVRMGSYTVATVPSAATMGAGATIYVSNEVGGPVLAFSDGTAWRRVTDRAVIA